MLKCYLSLHAGIHGMVAFEDVEAHGVKFAALCYSGHQEKQLFHGTIEHSIQVLHGFDNINDCKDAAKEFAGKTKVDVYACELGKWIAMPPNNSSVDIDAEFDQYIKSCIKADVDFARDVKSRVESIKGADDGTKQDGGDLGETEAIVSEGHVEINTESVASPPVPAGLEGATTSNSTLTNLQNASCPIPRPDQLYTVISIIKLDSEKLVGPITLFMVNSMFSTYEDAGEFMRKKKQAPRYKHISMYCVHNCKWLPYPPNDAAIYQQHESELKTQALNPLNKVDDDTVASLEESM